MDEKFEHWAKLTEQRHNKINGRNIWLFKVESSIGDVFIVDYEEHPDPFIKRQLFDMGKEDKATRHFESVCRKIISGKL